MKSQKLQQVCSALSLVLLCLAVCSDLCQARKYNILSLDAAKYAGLCTSKFVDYMEKNAYYLARQERNKPVDQRQFCYPLNAEKRVAMNELFDMVAGSETGAIIAATIAQPKEAGSQEAKHFAKKATDFFLRNIDVMYVDAALSKGSQVVIYFFVLLFVGVITYMAASYYFRNGSESKRIEQLKDLMRLNKRFVKGKINDEQIIEKEKNELGDNMHAMNQSIVVKQGGKDDADLLQIYRDMNKVRKKASTIQDTHTVDMQALEELIEIEKRLEQVRQRYQKRQAYPWYILFFTCVIIAIILQFGFIPAMEYTSVKIEDYTILEEDLKQFISSDKLDNVVFDNFLVTSWELTKRQPFILTKYSVTQDKTYEGFNDILKATLISAANPVYFRPVDVGDKIFIGGDSVAVSPAMLAFMAATEEGGIDPANIEIMSVGSLNERVDKIPEDIGAIEWLSRISSLTGQSKKHTQDYLLQQILEQYGTTLRKYSYPMSYEVSKELDEMDNRLEKLEYLCNDMLNEKLNDLVIDLKELMMERFSNDPKYQCT